MTPPTTYGKVKEFHQKQRQPITPVRPAMEPELMDRGDLVLEVKFLRNCLLRARLITEEMAELITAIHERNEVEIADGTADLDYVTAGTSIAFDLPHDAIVEEVHRSNMTKSALGSNSKGGKTGKDGWIPPNIAGVIAKFRRG